MSRTTATAPRRLARSMGRHAAAPSAPRRHSSEYGVTENPTYSRSGSDGSRTSGQASRCAGRAPSSVAQRSPPSMLRNSPRSEATTIISPIALMPRTEAAGSGSGALVARQWAPPSSLTHSRGPRAAQRRAGSPTSRPSASRPPVPMSRFIHVRAPSCVDQRPSATTMCTDSRRSGITSTDVTGASGRPAAASLHEAPQSSLRANPLQPARYARPGTPPRAMTRAGSAPRGERTARHSSSASLRKRPPPVATSARRPSVSKAAAKTAPLSTFGASRVQSRPPLRERSTPASVASSR